MNREEKQTRKMAQELRKTLLEMERKQLEIQQLQNAIVQVSGYSSIVVPETLRDEIEKNDENLARTRRLLLVCHRLIKNPNNKNASVELNRLMEEIPHET